MFGYFLLFFSKICDSNDCSWPFHSFSTTLTAAWLTICQILWCLTRAPYKMTLNLVTVSEKSFTLFVDQMKTQNSLDVKNISFFFHTTTTWESLTGQKVHWKSEHKTMHQSKLLLLSNWFEILKSNSIYSKKHPIDKNNGFFQYAINNNMQKCSVNFRIISV